MTSNKKVKKVKVIVEVDPTTETTIRPFAPTPLGEKLVEAAEEVTSLGLTGTGVTTGTTGGTSADVDTDVDF